MRKTFLTPGNHRGITVDFETRTIGSGKLGGKSAALREYQPLFDATVKVIGEEETGLITVPHVSITPALLSDFLRRIGASHEDPAAAIEAITRSDFGVELNVFREAISPFDGVYTAIRSDEATAAGVGLWHTDFVLSDSILTTTLKVADIIKKILKADFSRDVLAFKRRVGIPVDDTLGVLVMPVVGVDLSQMYSDHMFGSTFHANIITGFNYEGTLANIGVGVGGANNRGARSEILRIVRAIHLTKASLSMNIRNSKLLSAGELKNSADIPKAYDFLDMIIDGYNPLMDKLLRELLKYTNSLKTQLYLELALDRKSWNVLQCSPVKIENLEPPDVPDEQKILDIFGRGSNPYAQYGSTLSGRAVVKIDSVIYLKSLNREEIERLRTINQETSNYVLIVDAPPNLIGNVLRFADYSNAAAIVSNSTEALNNIGTHFNGAFREAGILFLVGEVNADFLAGLKQEKANTRKLLVYANDGVEEGFIAIC